MTLIRPYFLHNLVFKRYLLILCVDFARGIPAFASGSKHLVLY